MSREVVGTAEALAAPARTPTRPTRSSPPAAPAPRPRPARRPRRVVAALTLATAVGAVAGWSGAGSWRDAQRRQVALESAGASAVVVRLDGTVAGRAGDAAEGRRSAGLVVDVINLGAVPLTVAGRSDTFSAVRIRFLEPSDAVVPAAGRLQVSVVVEVACRSPQPLRVPPLQVTSPDGLVRDVALDGTAPALAQMCAVGAGPTRLTDSVAVPAERLVRGGPASGRNDVGDLIDGDRFRIELIAPSGRTTRVVGVRTAGLELDADPSPATVDGTPRALWLRRPAGCDPSVQRVGPPRYVDLDVDAGTGQTATVRILLGDAFAAWLLTGPCGRVTP